MWNPNVNTHTAHKATRLIEILEQDIASGHLVAGQQLPTQQALADITGLAKSTIARVYQKAHERGLIQTIVGRGSFVMGKSDSYFQAVGDKTDEILDLRLDHPVVEMGITLSRTLQQIATQNCHSLLSYQEHAGQQHCRQAGVTWLAWNGVCRTADTILMTGGAQHGLTVCLSSIARAGDSLLVEELTYPGIRETADMLEINLIPLPMDSEGVVPDSFSEALYTHKNVKAFYTIPSFQNPTAIRTSKARRHAIAALCRKAGLYIIEDDIHRLFADAPPVAYAEILPDLTFFIAGLSKAICGGLRVAYVAPPDRVYTTVKRRILATHWTLPPLMAEIATRWINDGTAQIIMTQKKTEIRARHALACRIIGQPFVRAAEPGAYIWIDLPPVWTAEIFISEAYANGIAVLGDGSFRVSPDTIRPGIRLCLSAAPDRPKLERGLKKMARMLRDGPAGLNIV